MTVTAINKLAPPPSIKITTQPPARSNEKRLIPAEYTDVYLAGELGKKFGRKWRLVCKTPRQAVKLISLARPDFKEHMLKCAKEGMNFHVICDKRSRTTEQVDLPAGKRLIISHQVAGAKGAAGSVLEIVAGLALVAVAVMQPELAPALLSSTGLTFTSGEAMAVGMIGMSLVMAGITALLSPQPTTPSYYFNGAANTIQQGQPVPVVYGEMMIGGLPIYSSLTAVNESDAPTETGLIVD
jgi:predicted phage tail protein